MKPQHICNLEHLASWEALAPPPQVLYNIFKCYTAIKVCCIVKEVWYIAYGIFSFHLPPLPGPGGSADQSGA